MKRGWEGRIVKGNRSGDTISGVITKTKRHYCDENEVEVVLAEVLFQAEGFNRAIYAYANDEFHIIKIVGKHQQDWSSHERGYTKRGI